MPDPRPIIVRAAGAGPASWERTLPGAPDVVSGSRLEEARAALGAGDCALVDGTVPDPVRLAREVHRLDAALQVVIVAPPAERARIDRAVLFSPGLGEVWMVAPAEVGPGLVERAADVTRRRRAYAATHARVEHALAAIEPHAARRAAVSDAYLAALLSALPDPVLSVDARGTVLTWTPAATRVLRHAREEAVGRPLADVLAPEDPAALARALARPAATEREEIRFRCRDGAPGVGELSVIPVEAGERRVLAVILHDVTAERRAQAEREAQAVELEMQAQELQGQATRLEEAQVELELANDELERANATLAEQTAEAEEARLRAEIATTRFEAVIRQMPSGVVLVEAPSGRVVLANEQVGTILRMPLPSGGDVGSASFPAFHPDGRPYRPEEWPLARALAGEAVPDEEIRIVRGDGTRGTLGVASAPIRNARGEIVAAVAIFDDVTDRREREDENAFLADAGRAFAFLLDHRETLRTVARLAVPRLADWCAVDVLEEGRIQRLAVVHSDPAREALAHEVAARWPVDPAATAGVPEVLRTGRPVLYPDISEEVLRASTRDEEHFRIVREVGLRSAMIVPLLARGRSFGAITLVAAESGRRYDASDLVFAEQLASRAAIAVDNSRLLQEAERARLEAEAANRAKSDFLATMSHEIRTPINAIVGYTDLLDLGIAGPITAGQREHLDRVRSSSRHLLTLIDDILDLAKVEAGRMEVARERVPAAATVAAALALVGPQAAASGIAIENGCPDGASPSFVGDEDRTRQILVNLLSNAVKFTGSGGTIRLTCGSVARPDPAVDARSDGPWTFVRVEDTGIGIAPDEIESVFRPFVQAESGLTRTRGGTGLGLPISRQLARRMGGDLTATSEVGRGSVFTLWLPGEAAAAPLEEAVLDDFRGDGPKRGVAAVGEALRDEIDRVLDAYVRRLAGDPLVPVAASLGRVELEDHGSALLTDIAQALIVLEESDRDAADLLRDGSEIQRVICDLHGAQRARLGWTEAALRREFEILREEIEAGVRRASPAEAEVGDALAVLARFVDQAERTSVERLRGPSGGGG